MFVIKSSDSGAELEFRNRNGDDCVVEFRCWRVSLVRDVYWCGPIAEPANGLAAFFDSLAVQQKPWAEEQSWESYEREFRIEAQCSALGKVALLIFMRFDNGVAEPWEFSATINTELGALVQIARSAREFFSDNAA